MATRKATKANARKAPAKKQTTKRKAPAKKAANKAVEKRTDKKTKTVYGRLDDAEHKKFKSILAKEGINANALICDLAKAVIASNGKFAATVKRAANKR